MTKDEFNDIIKLKKFEELLEKYSIALLNGERDKEEAYYNLIISQYILVATTPIKMALGNKGDRFGND